MQAKLLRVLGEQEVRPVGSNHSVRVNVRVITATNRDLATEVREGRFRDDLYYRLNVVGIQLPPLRERREDIPALAHFFLRKYAEANGKDIGGFSPDVLARFEAYAWPGNVRELENAIERVVAVSNHPIALFEDLPAHLHASTGDAEPIVRLTPDSLVSLDELTKQHLGRVLAATHGNKKRAAEILGVDRRTLYRMLDRYGLPMSDVTAEP